MELEKKKLIWLHKNYSKLYVWNNANDYFKLPSGAHIVAPSDMMDNRIKAIKDALVACKLQNQVSSSRIINYLRLTRSKPDQLCYNILSFTTDTMFLLIWCLDNKVKNINICIMCCLFDADG